MATELSTMRYRSKHEIVGEILTAATGGRAKTKIMYAASLSYAQTKSYLAWLIAENLLVFDESQQKYETSESGKRWLKEYRKVPRLNKGACPE